MTKTDILEITFEENVIRAFNIDGRYYFCAPDIKRITGHLVNHYQDVSKEDKIKKHVHQVNSDGSQGYLYPQTFLTIKGITDWLKYFHDEIKQDLFNTLMFESDKEDCVVQTKLEFDAKDVDKFENVFRNTERVNDLTNQIAKLKKALEHEMSKPTKEQMKAYLQGMGL